LRPYAKAVQILSLFRPLLTLVSPKNFMKINIGLVIMIVLSLICLNTTIQIEILNFKANFYLPRTDDCSDGKWRISPYSTPRDRLRGMISSFGLYQYIFAPILFILSTAQIKKNKASKVKITISIVCLISSILSIIFMFYRGYSSSLCT